MKLRTPFPEVISATGWITSSYYTGHQVNDPWLNLEKRILSPLVRKRATGGRMPLEVMRAPRTDEARRGSLLPALHRRRRIVHTATTRRAV